MQNSSRIVLALCVAFIGRDVSWAQNPAVTVTVDVQANRHPINPNIYGINGGDTPTLQALNAPLNRYGGDPTSRYNWQLNADNRAADLFFESLGDTSAVAGERGDTFFSASKSAGAVPMITIPMIGWVAKLGANRTPLASFSIAKYGPQTANSVSFPDAGNGVLASTGMNITGNNPNDANIAVDSSYQQQWVRHLVSTWGTATAGGLTYYILDNEPSLWYSTHRDVHPTGPTMAEVESKIVDYAGQIKSIDPSALVVAPEESAYSLSGYDQQYGLLHGWTYLPDRVAHGNMFYLPWLLQQLKLASVAGGLRPIDVFSVHYYPTPAEYSEDVSTATQLLRNRSTRALWDTTYTAPGWNAGPYVIPQMQAWVSTYYYPGTPIALTEYKWGADGNINGATAQADVLGIFGREGLDFAARWVPDATTPTFKAMQMYRNYDGSNSTFGDTSVSATVPSPDTLSAFAAMRSSDGALTVIVISKSLSGNTPLTLALSNYVPLGTVQTFQLTSANTIARLPDATIPGTTLSTSLPPQSITLFVIPAEPPVLAVLLATPTVGNAPLTVAFDGTRSRVLTGTIASYGWHFGDGSTATGATASHNYATPGIYQATLTVTGSTGLNASSTLTITANGALLPPAGLQAAPGDKQATLSWHPSSWATSYLLKRGTGSSGPFATVASGITSTTAVDASLTDGTIYYYVVSAVDADGQSANSASVTVKPAATVRFEAESLTLGAVSNLVTPAVVSDPKFSGGAGMYFDTSTAGQYATFLVNVPDARSYDIQVGLKDSSNKAIWQLSVDGLNQGPAIDSYAATPAYLAVDLGAHTFASSGAHSFRFTVVGENASSSGMTLSLDYITLVPR